MYGSLFELIAEHPMDQRELARRLKITEQVVSGWAGRGASPKWWGPIMKELPISLDALLGALSMKEIEKGISENWFRRLGPRAVDFLRLGLRQIESLPEEDQVDHLEAARALVESRRQRKGRV